VGTAGRRGFQECSRWWKQETGKTIGLPDGSRISPWRLIHAEGTLRVDGLVREATREVKWPKAEELKKTREDAGTLGVALAIPTSPHPKEPPTVEHVAEQFTHDRKACGLRPGTLKK
jgi:hypothetical protein